MRTRIGLLVVVAGLACGGVPGGPAAGGPAAGGPGGSPAGPGVSSGTRAASGLPTGALHLQQMAIPDNGGFGRPMTAATILVPVGWKGEGGVRWNTGDPCAEPAAFDWKAHAPDGRTRVGLFPTQNWGAGTTGSNGCMPADFRDARSYLEAIVRSQHPDMRVVEYKPRPDFLEPTRQQFDDLARMMAQSGIRAWTDAGELVYTFEDQGVPMEGLVAVSAAFYGGELANPMGGPPIWYLTGGTTGTFSARAPAGALDRELAEAIRRSVRADPAWSAEMAKLQAKLGQIRTDGVRQRAAIIVAAGAAQTEATIAANQAATQGWSERQAADDRRHQQVIDGIRGVERYNDPSGGTVTLDQNWNHAWKLNDGTYVLVDDPSFNPDLALGIQGQQLTPTP